MSSPQSDKPQSGQRIALVLLCAAQLMCIADISIVNIALPSLETDLHMGPTALQWVITAYNVAYGAFLLIGGRMGDLLGRRRMFRLGLAIFTLASAVGGVSINAAMLLSARAAQGLGAALISPAVVSLITHLFAEGEGRNRALGAIGGVSGAGFALGLLLGGLLTGTVGWRWVFFINLPIGLCVWLMATRLLPETPRTRQPLLPPGLFRHRSLIGAVIASMAFGVVVTPQSFMLTFYLQNVSHFSPMLAGISFLPQEIVLLIGANVAGRYVGRFGIRNTLAAGLLFFGVATLFLLGMNPAGGYVTSVLPALLLGGLAISCAHVAGSLAATTGVPAPQHGLAAGVYNTGMQLGSALGMGFLMSAASARTATLLRAGAVIDEVVATISGYRVALMLALMCTLLGAAAVLALVPRPARTT